MKVCPDEPVCITRLYVRPTSACIISRLVHLKNSSAVKFAAQNDLTINIHDLTSNIHDLTSNMDDLESNIHDFTGSS